MGALAPLISPKSPLRREAGPAIKVAAAVVAVVALLCCVYMLAPGGRLGPPNRLRMRLNLDTASGKASWEAQGDEAQVRDVVAALGAAALNTANHPSDQPGEQGVAQAAGALTSLSEQQHGDDADSTGSQRPMQQRAGQQAGAEGDEQGGVEAEQQAGKEEEEVQEEPQQPDVGREEEEEERQKRGSEEQTGEQGEEDEDEEGQQQDAEEEGPQQHAADQDEQQEEQRPQQEPADSPAAFGGAAAWQPPGDSFVEGEASEAKGSKFASKFQNCDNDGQLSCLNRQAKYPLGTSGGQRQFRFPHFYLAGFQKCATTSLFHHLTGHPQVQRPSNKEPEFFTRKCSYNAMRCVTSQQRMYMRDTLGFRTVQAANFTKAAFEGSTHYALEGRWLAMQLREHFPWIKIVISMREPISQAISMLNHQLDHKRVPDCYDRDKGLVFDCVLEDLDYESRYAKSIRPWVKHIPRQQLHVIQYENLTSTAGMAPALRDLKRFLELDPLLPSDDLGLYNYRHQRKTGHKDGWPMSRSQYEQLLEKARRNAEEIVEIVREQGFGDPEAWMANWQAAWQSNLDGRCGKEPESQCWILLT